MLDTIEQKIKSCINRLKPIIISYVNRNDKIRVLDEPYNLELGEYLGDILNLKIIDELENYNDFCIDDVMPLSINVDNREVFTYYGFIYWLNTPNNYLVNESGKDPFYCQFKVENNHVELISIFFGDYQLEHIDIYANYREYEPDWVFKFY